MGFNKKILPELEKLKEWYERDKDSLMRSIINSDALIGPEESITWVKEKMKENGGSTKK
jgi:hypothetical protein